MTYKFIFFVSIFNPDFANITKAFFPQKFHSGKMAVAL